ncbi:MAG TPA: diacylglycerol kinase family protein [Opitutaceae bacterium]|nr:diacylglycerol kinase family protein [Opitutaceae bacterium]
MPLKTRFIVNPRSGAARRALPHVEAFAARHRAEIVRTEHPRHAAELARRALDERCELIVAVGGDGTMNEIAGVVTGSGATLGLVPCGSGDGLGRHLGIHGTFAHALEILACGEPRLIDTGLADGHPFFTVAGLGFEAHVAEKFNHLEHRGFFRYLTTAAAAFREWQPLDCTIEHAGRRERIRAFTLAVGNSDQYGNGARIAPGARIDDGLLDLCAVPPVNLLNAAPLLARLFAGSLAGARGILLRRAERFVVERAAPGPIHTDGEVHAAGPRVEFRVVPASLRLMAPARGAS